MVLVAYCLNFTNVVECLMHRRSLGHESLLCSTWDIAQIPGHSCNNTSKRFTDSLCARHWAKCLKCMISLSPHNNSYSVSVNIISIL